MKTALKMTTVLGGKKKAFDPLTLSPLLWLKADAGLFKDAAMAQPATADADLIYTWADQSGNGNHFVQATEGSRPAKSGVGVAFANKTLANAGIVIPRPVDVFMVVSYTHANYQGLMQSATGATVIATDDSSGKLIVRDTSSTYGISPTSVPVGQNVIMNASFNGGNSFFAANGGTRFTNASFPVVENSTNLTIGKATSISSTGVTMTVAEFLVFGALTEAQRTLIGKYLSQKWSVATSF